MSNSQSPNLTLDYLMPDQAQKHVTLNETIRRLDSLVQLSVTSRSQTTPPTTPQNGMRYLVPTGASGTWTNHSGKLAFYEDTAWQFIPPKTGWRLWDETDQSLLAYNGTKWVNLNQNTLSGVEINRIDAVMDFSKTLPNIAIPSHTLHLGVTARITQTITGTTSWQLGIANSPNKFGNGLPVTSGSTINGPTSPNVYWQNTPILVSTSNGSLTSGIVKLSIFYLSLPIPAA